MIKLFNLLVVKFKQINSRTYFGFSLLELSVSLISITFLSCITVQIFKQELMNARRPVAQKSLLQAANKMKSYYLKHHTYIGATLNILKLNNLKNNFYKLKFTNLSSDSFTILAIPINFQANDEQCATLSIDQYGFKYANGTTRKPVKDCW